MSGYCSYCSVEANNTTYYTIRIYRNKSIMHEYKTLKF